MAKAKKSKKNAKVVVYEAHFNLIERKASMLDRLFADGDQILVGVEDFKEWGQIEKDCNKADALDVDVAFVEPYKESVQG